MTDQGWDQFLAEVLESREAALRQCEDTPLEFGQAIAWSSKMMGRTDGFSEVHRVGYPQHGEPYTTCGELIRGPYGWLPLSPAMIRTMAKCRRCEAEFNRILKELAA